MKLCQKCADAINFVMQDVQRGEIPRTKPQQIYPMGQWFSESECEFWAHRVLNGIPRTFKDAYKPYPGESADRALGNNE